MSLIFAVTGGESEVIKALVICMTCDYITGIIKAIKRKKFKFLCWFLRNI